VSEEQIWQLVTVAAAWIGIQGVIDFKNGS